jgi:hypothetical protein
MSSDTLAFNGERLTRDESGWLVDSLGKHGYTTHFTGAYICYTCGHLCECAELYGCGHTLTVCPNHAGGYDCTPFCRVCEGSQDYCSTCDPIECNCGCGCTNPLNGGTCVDCSINNDHQNNNKLIEYVRISD